MENVMRLNCEEFNGMRAAFVNYCSREMDSFWSNLCIDLEGLKEREGTHTRTVICVLKNGTWLHGVDREVDGMLEPVSDAEAAASAAKWSVDRGDALVCVAVVVSFEDGSYDLKFYEAVA